MTNELTGGFDVVAQFAIPAVNRLLAAMHQTERFLHSLAVRVDDNPPPGSKFVRPSIVASVDSLGETTVDHSRLGTVALLAGASAAAARISSALDPLVNPDLAGAFEPPVVPSRLQGRAQLQLAPPIIEVTDASGNTVTVKLSTMARYFPDAHTSPLTEFLRGELQLTARVDQVVSQQLRVIDVNLKADQITVSFSQAFPAQPLSAEDSAGLSLLIRNALKTSFLPSSTALPDTIDYARFKTLLGGQAGTQNAISLMLNMARFDANGQHVNPGGPGNPVSVNRNFVEAEDDFGFAASTDFVLEKIQLSPIPNRRVFLYNLSFQLPTLEFQAGKILWKVRGHAEGSHWYSPPAFNFTVTQAFNLRLRSTTGGPLNTAELEVDGDVSVDPWYADIATLFSRGDIRNQRDQNISDNQPFVWDALDVNKNLGAVLNPLLFPAEQKQGVLIPGSLPREQPKVALAYTSVDIETNGIILHGSMGVPDWRPVHVEYAEIPSAAGSGPGIGVISDAFSRGPDHSALRSWIPGGTIQEYEWFYQGQAQPYIDTNKFVLASTPPGASMGSASSPAGTPPPPSTVSPGYAPLCLTVRGWRYSSSGPVVPQPVSASQCGYTSFPIVDGLGGAHRAAVPLVALTGRGAGGLVEVTGHAAAAYAEPGSERPNRLILFADDRTASDPGFLLEALRESGRGEDASTVVVAVLTREQLARARHTEGIIYGEEQGGAWQSAFGVTRRPGPLILVVGPKGNHLWRHEGEPDRGMLAAALRRVLVKSGPVRQRMLRSNLRIDQLAPNFGYEIAGRITTLRKTARQATLVFYRNASRPSLQAVLDLQKTTGQAGEDPPLLLAINDGDPPESAKKVAREYGLTAVVVPDPDRNISLAYNVSIWPTIAHCNESGRVTSFRYGRFTVEPGASGMGGVARHD